jgi:hypothetical protein
MEIHQLEAVLLENCNEDRLRLLRSRIPWQVERLLLARSRQANMRAGKNIEAPSPEEPEKFTSLHKKLWSGFKAISRGEINPSNYEVTLPKFMKCVARSSHELLQHILVDFYTRALELEVRVQMSAHPGVTPQDADKILGLWDNAKGINVFDSRTGECVQIGSLCPLTQGRDKQAITGPVWQWATFKEGVHLYLFPKEGEEEITSLGKKWQWVAYRD